jgi:RNA ligase (TIGR02306 family)
MRKLASTRIIKEIKEHTNADSLELAVVDGWQVVVKKGEFSPGDYVTYFEIDSVLPIKEEYEFLRKCCYIKRDWLPNGEGFRLKTIKLRGELSQGLVLPLPKGFVKVEGTDCTGALGVVKWDPPIPAQLAGLAKGNFPNFIPKTDLERAQNLVDELKNQVLHFYEVTLKLDGTSCTVYHNNGEIGVCSRNLELKLSEENADNSYVRAATKSGLLKALGSLGINIAVQGEILGPGIQKNPEKLKDVEFFIFDIFNINTQQYLTPSQRQETLRELRKHGYVGAHVPIINGYEPLTNPSIEDLLERAKGESLTASVREGIVYKSYNENRFTFKVINNDYLLLE